MALPADMMKPVNKMFCDAVMVESVPFDWGKGFAETWDTILPSPEGMSLNDIKCALEDLGWDLPATDPYEMLYDEIVGLLEDNGFDAPDVEGLDEQRAVNAALAEVEQAFKDDDDFLSEWREAYEEAMQEQQDRFTPMMNFYYPLPSYDDDRMRRDQRLLDQYGGAVVLVEVDERPVLALSGGGMDLSWDICEAYMLLGYLPPFTFTRLPEFHGDRLTPAKAWVIEGCQRTAQVIKQWVSSREETLADLKRKMENP